MKREGNSNKIGGHVSSGADPSSYGKPVSIPQDAPKGSGTGEGFEAYFDFDGDGERENDRD